MSPLRFPKAVLICSLVKHNKNDGDWVGSDEYFGPKGTKVVFCDPVLFN